MSSGYQLYNVTYNSYATKNIKNKAVLNLKQYYMHCYVAHSNIFQLIRMKTCIHYCLFNYETDKKADQLCGILIFV